MLITRLRWKWRIFRSSQSEALLNLSVRHAWLCQGAEVVDRGSTIEIRKDACVLYVPSGGALVNSDGRMYNLQEVLRRLDALPRGARVEL